LSGLCRLKNDSFAPSKPGSRRRETARLAAMFFSIPATGKAREKKPTKESKKKEAPLSIPPPPPGPSPPLPPEYAPTEPKPAEVAPEDAAHAAAAARYPSMRPDFDAEARAAAEAPRQAKHTTDPPVRPTSVFLSNLPLMVRDSELQTFLRGCGVIQSIRKVRDRGVFNGCAIITFGGVGAVERALELSGKMVGGKAVTIGLSLRKGIGEHEEDDGGNVFDAMNNRLFPHDVPEAHLDFKKRRIMYPKDHDR